MNEITNTTSWHSYPSVYALGHKAIDELLLDDVLVEEKIDGSQFSFGRFGGELKVRSHHKQMIPEAPEKLFAQAVETVAKLDLRDGWTYRGECLCKPKHNALAYDRIPTGGVILFDINIGEESYLSYDAKKEEASRIGPEVVPRLAYGKIASAENIKAFLAQTSILGGQTIEGVVIKNYSRFGKDKKCLMGKYVSEAFKEVFNKVWGENNPRQNDILQQLIVSFKTPARWNKSIQHLREAGDLEDSPRDIGKLIKEIQADIRKECELEIKQALYEWAIPTICRACSGGFPEYYKAKLLDKQFEGNNKKEVE